MQLWGWWRSAGLPSAFVGFCCHLLALTLLCLLQRIALVCSSQSPDPSTLKVVGSTNLPVKVYVKLNHNSPRILCVTNRLRNSELIDPIFQWHGPGGDLVTENETVKITQTGTLLFRHFQRELSGVYTCSLVFKPSTEEDEKSYLIKYVIYAYSDPNSYYEFTARYHAAPCNSIYNSHFEKKLLQAKDLVEKFFSQQVEVLGKRTAPLPEIYYIEGTLQVVWVRHCFPGYGINALLHPGCPNCCVICSPGTYNPHEGTHCLQCNKSLEYGAKNC